MVLGGLMFFLGVVPSALVVRRQPEDLGLTIDGVAPTQRAITSDPGLGDKEVSRDGEISWSLGQVIRTPAFWVILVSLFIVSSATSGIGLHLVPHLTQQGLSAPAAVGAISIMSTSGALGALALGLMAERISPRLMITLAYLLGAVSMVVLLMADTLAETYLFAVLQGLAGTGVNTLAPILWAHYYGRASLGSIYGLSRAAQVSGFALGPLVSGIVYDATGSYRSAFIYFAFLAVVAAVIVLASRRPASRTGIAR
jgi:predicted MFS family arabinose efflux permease